jgi:hypothetical protein
MPRLVHTAIAVSLLLMVPHVALGQGGFVGPSSGGPTTGTLNATQTVLTYNAATYPIVNGKVTFPDCTVYIAASNGFLIPAGMAVGCTPGGSSSGGFAGPGTGGPATGSVSGSILTYNGATYPIVNGRVTFPDCTVYIAMDSGLLIPAGTAAGCGPGGGAAFVGPATGGPATGSVDASETQLTYNGTTYPLVNGRVTFPDCTVYIALRSGILIPAGMAAGCTPGGGGTTPTRTTPTITWANPSSVVAGTILGGTQLNAAANVAGSFVYSPAAGVALAAGTQTLSVTFTPTNTTSYTTATAGVTIVVTASGGSSFVGPGSGGPATGSVDASETQLTYNGTTYPLVNGRVTFPDCTVYIALRSGMLIPAGVAAGCTPGGGGTTPTRTTPTITWANPSSVVAGTILGGTQLNATASVAGSFVYSPAAGVALAAGTQTLSATFTPTNTTSYTTATAGVTIVVTASGGGSFVGPSSGGPATGSVSGDVLTYSGATYPIVNGKVTFPDCTMYYAMGSGLLVPAGMAVNCTPGGQAKPIVTWPTPAPVASGTVLSGAQLNASATIPGSFVYAPAAGTVPADGTVTLSVTFTPTDRISYSTATATVSLRVGAAAAGLGPSNGGPTTGTLNGSVLTYNGATFNVNANGQVQLPDCKVYMVAASGALLIYSRDATTCNVNPGGSGGTPTGVPGPGPIQTWSAAKKVVDIGRVSIFAMGMAYDAATQRYLLVWRAGTSACGNSDVIWGQFLDSNADPLGSKFYISLGNNCVWAYDAWEPAVAASGDGRFMVAYAVNLAGGITPFSVVFNLVEYNGGPQVGPPSVVDTGTSREGTAVAWMPHAQQFMVMWSKFGPPRNTKVLYSMAVTRDGGPAQIHQVTDNVDFIDMATAQIAQGADNNLMVIGWRDSSNAAMAPNGGISYTQVSESGAPIMNTGNIVGPSSTWYRYQRVAYNAQTQKYLSIYTDYASPGCDGGASGGNIMGRNFNLNGTPVESESYILLATNRCNGGVGDDQFTELGLAYEPVNNAFVIGGRGNDGPDQPNLPAYRMVTDPSGKVYQGSVNSQPLDAASTSPMPTIVADGTGRVLIAYRADYVSIWVMFGSK